MLSGVVTGSLLREVNLQVVYRAVREAHPVSRAQLARRLGTSKPTTGRSVDALLAAGLIREAAPPADATSYGAVFFEPCPDAAVVLGLDVGSRYVRGLLVDLAGVELARADLPLTAAGGPAVLARAVEVRDRLLKQAGVADVSAAAVGIGGVIDPRTGEVRVANQHELNGFAATAGFRAALGVPVVVENDVNLAAVGEGAHGAGAGVRNFAFLSVGSGVGAGLVLAGELHRGQHGAAGEIDYVRADREFDPRSPAADAFLAHAEQRLARSSGSVSSGTVLRSPVTAEAVMAAARTGDALAVSLVRLEATRIARAAAGLTRVVDVELIVLGGGLGLNGDLLLEPVRAALAELTPYPPRVEVSRLGAATLTGAVVVALRAVLEDLVPSRVAAAG
ncbi:ROK family transcriptional regulator [Amycolatopsis mediterranei]|uniref:ROK family transcriptional regulator n=1 Tax=Amycolatopsis mediterranei TaxID=33910 RepID=UPI0036083820